MTPSTPVDDPDEPLAEALRALGNATRIRLLRSLQAPKVLHEIEVPIVEDDHARNIARQTVRSHLDKLIEAGFVVMRETERNARRVPEYSLNQQALFALVEEVRALAHLQGLVEPASMTREDGARSRLLDEGPALVLVKGVEEGRVFPLRAAQPGPWLIGRRRGVDVPLEYDPYSSAENTRIARRGQGFVVEDLETSRNGTSLNLRPLPKGEAHPLRHGDLIGVGRSLLVFRA